MNYKILIWCLICLFFITCTTTGPKKMFMTDGSTGDVMVPVEYIGGLETLNKKTKGTLYITETSTRFVSDKGTVHLNKPTSSIRSMYVKDEVKLKLGKTALRYLFLGPFAFLIKDKSELISFEFMEDEESLPIYAIFKIRVGTGDNLRSAILDRQKLAIAEESVTEGSFVKKAVTRKTVLERDWEEAIASDSISAYEDFIRKYPHTEFTEKARSRLKDIFLEKEWESTKSSDSILKYEDFLKRNPDSKFTQEARSRLDMLKGDKLAKKQAEEEVITSSKVPPEQSKIEPSVEEIGVLRLVIQKSSDVTRTIYHYDGAFRTGSTTALSFKYSPELHIQKSLKAVGFRIIQEDSKDREDITLVVNYEEKKRGHGLNFPTAFYFSFTVRHATLGTILQGSANPDGCDSVEELQNEPQFRDIGLLVRKIFLQNLGLNEKEKKRQDIPTRFQVI